MPKTKIYHNPRCSKSRQTLKILEDQGEDIQIIDYLKDPPSASELEKILKLLNKEPLEIIRTKEDKFKELGLSTKDKKSLQAWTKIMSDNPILIERPIVVKNNKAALGRPPESVLEIL